MPTDGGFVVRFRTAIVRKWRECWWMPNRSRVLSGLLCAFAAMAAEPVDIGSRRELFADRYLIDKLIGADHRWQHPV